MARDLEKPREGTDGRDPHLDNIRTILIVLVVVGHAIAVSGRYTPALLYTWIYTFHMPAFVTLAGFLSRSFTAQPRQYVRLVSTLIVPYLLFQVIHAAITSLTHDVPFDPDVFRPSVTLWFLVSLATWRIATPLLRVLRYPLVFAVVAALLVPLDSSVGHWLSVGRTFAFLPFFVLGLMARPDWLARLRTRRARVLGAATLVVMAAITPILVELPRRALLRNRSYAALDLTVAEGMALWAVLLVLGFAGTVAIAAVAPRTPNVTAVVGRNSITVYLLHGLLFLLLINTDPLAGLGGPVQAALLTAGGVVVAAVLGSPVVARLTRWLVQPRWSERVVSGYRATH